MSKTPVTRLADLENLPIKGAGLHPHPSLLSRWSDAGLYRIDADKGVFLLTEKGREVARQQEGEA